MGSAIGKNNGNSACNEQAPDPLYAIAATLNTREDPRSPGSKRTPVSTPFESPCGTPTTTRRRMVVRLGSASKFGALDPRSPASRRTPHHDVGASAVKATPPPFSLADPRSPFTTTIAGNTRTPLALSAMDTDAVVGPDDVVIVSDGIVEGIIPDPEERQEIDEMKISKGIENTDDMKISKGASTDEMKISKGIENTAESSAGPESTCGKVTTETFNSPDVPSQTIMALAVSPVNSPSLGSRKRKDHSKAYSYTPSPLKKSYSAPMDENTPSSPVNKPLKNRVQARAPLSPLSANKRHQCTEIQPIKLRMDPSIL